METERLRSSQIQAERTLEARERSHRQRVKGLEEQVATLKDQLGQEIRKRQAYIRFGSRNYLVSLFAPMAQLFVNEGQHGFNTSLFKVLANVILVDKFWKSQRVAISEKQGGSVIDFLTFTGFIDKKWKSSSNYLIFLKVLRAICSQ